MEDFENPRIDLSAGVFVIRAFAHTPTPLTNLALVGAALFAYYGLDLFFYKTYHAAGNHKP